MNEDRCSRCGALQEEIELTCRHCGSTSRSEMSLREVTRLKSRGRFKRFAYLFAVWTLNGLFASALFGLVLWVFLSLIAVDPLLSVGLLIVAVPIGLAGIAGAIFLHRRGDRRPSPMRIQDWKDVEFDEVPDKTPEEAAQHDAFLKRQKRIDRRREWTDSPNADLDP